jgi:N-acetylglucosaminyldiphosphoundecaprenol N-acetyl-beta-D-mannosaminyltransferase
MDKINILGVNISLISKTKVLEQIGQYLAGEKQYQIVTPNPEIILTAIGSDEELFYILNKADIAIADGIGLKIASWLTGENIERITGADLAVEILRLAESQHKKVAVFNWRGGLSDSVDIKAALLKKFPDLKLYIEDVEREAAFKLDEVKRFSPDIIFCNLGAPYQEKFIFHNLVKLPSAKIGLGVGGAFDFLTGKLKRAPQGLRKIGLEWLWRLLKQPWRLQRIVNAVIIFPAKFFSWRFILPWRYRENVACILFKQESEKYKILIVERTDDPGHWQLPQGGRDGQEIKIAGARELAEELNTCKFKPLASFKNLHKYEFGERMSKFLVPAQKARGYKGQRQDLFIAEFTGADEDIEINFYEHRAWRWVEAEKLAKAVHACRQEATKVFLERFLEIVKK